MPKFNADPDPRCSRFTFAKLDLSTSSTGGVSSGSSTPQSASPSASAASTWSAASADTEASDMGWTSLAQVDENLRNLASSYDDFRDDWGITELGKKTENLSIGPALPKGCTPEPAPVSYTIDGGFGGYKQELFRLFPKQLKPTCVNQQSDLITGRDGDRSFGSISPPERTSPIQPPSPSSPTLGRPVTGQHSAGSSPSQTTPDESSMPFGGWDFYPNLLDDFQKNGRDCDLDEFDHMMLRSSACKERKPRRLPTLAELAKMDQTDPMIQRTTILRQIIDSNDPAYKTWLERIKRENKMCRFCWKNGETELTYKSHNLKDKNGNITCPILYVYTCPQCGACKHAAHTKKYCPYTSSEDAVSICDLKTGRNSTGRRRALVATHPGPNAMQYRNTRSDAFHHNGRNNLPANVYPPIVHEFTQYRFTHTQPPPVFPTNFPPPPLPSSSSSQGYLATPPPLYNWGRQAQLSMSADRSIQQQKGFMTTPQEPSQGIYSQAMMGVLPNISQWPDKRN